MNRRRHRAAPKAAPPKSPARPHLERMFAEAVRLQQDGRVAEAEALYRELLAVMPGEPHLLGNLGAALRSQGRLDDAIAAYRQAIAVKPDFAELHSNLGTALKDQGRLEDAVIAYGRAIAIKPDFAEAHSNLGTALAAQGEAAAAIAAYRRAIAIKPDFAAAFSNILVTLPFIPAVGAAAILDEARRFGARFEPPPRFEPPEDRLAPARPRDPDPERRLRVGYLTPNLCTHVLAPYLEPVFRAHRRDLFSVHVYAQVPFPDGVTRHLQTLVDSWSFVHDRSDAEVAARIAADGIDILVDPMGHWSGNRLLVFARKPAPLQVAYLCQGVTTGLTAMDYAIGDAWLNEGGAMQRHSVEQVVELPGGFQVTSFGDAPPIGGVPMDDSGIVTLASFNNPAKISDDTLALWAAVMAAVPAARLMIKGNGLGRPEAQARLRDRLRRHGIGDGRCELWGQVAAADYLRIHDRVDIMLDTAPFTGGRTTLDALWMGVPVVTLVGEPVHARYSYSHLVRAGAAELAARTAGQYVAIAAELAGDPARLRRYRRSLRPALQASTLLDGARHGRELEAAFRLMWRRRCAGLPPAGFRLEPEPAGS